MEIAYTAHTETCTLLLDAEGICRSVAAVQKPADRNGGRPARIPASAERCIGAQYVATLDLSIEGGMGKVPTPGAQMLFARVEKNGRISLVRSAPLLRFEAMARPRVPALEEEWREWRESSGDTETIVRQPKADAAPRRPAPREELRGSSMLPPREPPGSPKEPRGSVAPPPASPRELRGSVAPPPASPRPPAPPEPPRASREAPKARKPARSPEPVHPSSVPPSAVRDSGIRAVPAVPVPAVTYTDDDELTIPFENTPTERGYQLVTEGSHSSSIPPPPKRNSGVVPAGTAARATIPPPPPAIRETPDRPSYAPPPSYSPPSMERWSGEPAPKSLPKRPSIVRVSAPFLEAATQPFKRAAR